MNKLFVLALLVVLLAVSALGYQRPISRPMTAMRPVPKLYSISPSQDEFEGEFEGEFEDEIAEEQFGISGNYGGFSGGATFGGGKPTFNGGYQGSFDRGNGQFNVGASKGPGGWGATAGVTWRF